MAIQESFISLTLSNEISPVYLHDRGRKLQVKSPRTVMKILDSEGLSQNFTPKRTYDGLRTIKQKQCLKMFKFSGNKLQLKELAFQWRSESKIHISQWNRPATI